MRPSFASAPWWGGIEAEISSTDAAAAAADADDKQWVEVGDWHGIGFQQEEELWKE